MTTLERFTRKIDTSGECWNWTANKSPKGYGQFKIAARNVPAHRMAYELFVGPVPAGLVVDHLCRNRGCVRPDHLEPVTSRENTLRGVTLAASQVSRTHCPRGHEYAGGNLRLSLGGRRRHCRACSAHWPSRRRA